MSHPKHHLPYAANSNHPRNQLVTLDQALASTTPPRPLGLECQPPPMGLLFVLEELPPRLLLQPQTSPTRTYQPATLAQTLVPPSPPGLLGWNWPANGTPTLIRLLAHPSIWNRACPLFLMHPLATPLAINSPCRKAIARMAKSHGRHPRVNTKTVTDTTWPVAASSPTTPMSCQEGAFYPLAMPIAGDRQWQIRSARWILQSLVTNGIMGETKDMIPSLFL
jgi:hypothetical protein